MWTVDAMHVHHVHTHSFVHTHMINTQNGSPAGGQVSVVRGAPASDKRNSLQSFIDSSLLLVFWMK